LPHESFDGNLEVLARLLLDDLPEVSSLPQVQRTGFDSTLPKEREQAMLGGGNPLSWLLPAGPTLRPECPLIECAVWSGRQPVPHPYDFLQVRGDRRIGRGGDNRFAFGIPELDVWKERGCRRVSESSERHDDLCGL